MDIGLVNVILVDKYEKTWENSFTRIRVEKYGNILYKYGANIISGLCIQRVNADAFGKIRRMIRKTEKSYIGNGGHVLC